VVLNVVHRTSTFINPVHRIDKYVELPMFINAVHRIDKYVELRWHELRSSTIWTQYVTLPLE